MKSLADCRLYTFVDTICLRGRDPVEAARQLCAGGADIIQIRAKEIAPLHVEMMAREILPITRAAGVWLVVNDYFDEAARIPADACHLGQEDFFGAGYRLVETLRVPCPSIKVGLSSHAPEQARRAIAAGADYIAIGPVFATGTKPDTRPTTLEYVRWAATNVSIPWFAIGGITLANLDEVLAAGATRICVVSAILEAADIAEACRQFKQRLPR